MIHHPLLGHCTDYCVVYFYFFMNTANKDKGKLFLCSWQWHVQGGTALHQIFLIVASDGGEWSDFLCCNHFSIRQKNTCYHWIWGRFGPWTSLNVLYKWKIFWTYKEFDPDFLAHNLITIVHIHISTVLMYFFGCWIGQHVGKNQKRFWEQLQNGKGHRLTVFWSALCRVRCFFPSFTVPTNTMMKVDGWPPKSILELIWKVTEGNWNV